MKSVGLDDTKSMVALNSEENKILGRWVKWFVFFLPFWYNE
jgi:hypothetical protein